MAATPPRSAAVGYARAPARRAAGSRCRASSQRRRGSWPCASRGREGWPRRSLAGRLRCLRGRSARPRFPASELGGRARGGSRRCRACQDLGEVVVPGLLAQSSTLARKQALCQPRRRSAQGREEECAVGEVERGGPVAVGRREERRCAGGTGSSGGAACIGSCGGAAGTGSGGEASPRAGELRGGLHREEQRRAACTRSSGRAAGAGSAKHVHALHGRPGTSGCTARRRGRSVQRASRGAAAGEVDPHQGAAGGATRGEAGGVCVGCWRSSCLGP
ncbi:WAG22 antigen-like [Panicum virgatum]|uniref:WAG22 antigen-like n=1 Tax=Panicum virgatum TaxID=38727 RepID=UPI0019D61D79|nr:WAG22 antigen-like [Panicum virgatum]